MSYSKIVDNFYLGNQDATQIIKKVDLIISIGCNSKHISSHVENMKISIRDKDTSDITPFLDPVCDTVNAHLSKNRKVLIHCKAGMNRSPAFVIAYLMKYNGMSLEQAQNHIQKIRKIHCKQNFMEQITKHFNLEDSDA
jgi:protein-tyrosine phosphatase